MILYLQLIKVMCKVILIFIILCIFFQNIFWKNMINMGFTFHDKSPLYNNNRI
jgi:hypothetical protein